MEIRFYVELKQEGPGWLATLPDFPALSICGASFWDAMARAERALNATLEEYLVRENPLPAPTDYQGKMGYFPIQVRARILQAYVRKGDPKA